MDQGKKTVVLGASTNPERYSNKATLSLKKAGHHPVLVGLREGDIEGIPILTGKPEIEDVDTVTLYVGPSRQPELYDYILSLRPKRIIFNPGTENDELAQLAEKEGVETEQACTLVLLSLGNY